MIVAVILAAGEASRMGQPKQLLDWLGTPLICHVARQVLACDFDQVRLVLGAYATEIRPWVDDLELEVVENPDYAQGQSTSLRRGLVDLQEGVEGVAFILADQPLIQVHTYQKLIHFFQEKKPGILIPTYQGQPGNPKIFHRRWINELIQVIGDQGGRELIRQHPKEVQWVEVADPGILLDIDEESDYWRLLDL